MHPRTPGLLLTLGIALFAVEVVAADTKVTPPPKVSIAFNRLYDYPELVENLKALVAAHPDLLTMKSIGKSIEKRDMWCLESLATLLAGRPSIITPHPAEMGRLLGISTAEVLANRFEIGGDVARRLGGAVLLKGTPTVVFSSNGERYVSAAGTAALATGGSGDVLTGIASTLLVQCIDAEKTPAEAAACAAFIHGRAAELCDFVRGTTLDDILRALPAAWNERPRRQSVGVLSHLACHR